MCGELGAAIAPEGMNLSHSFNQSAAFAADLSAVTHVHTHIPKISHQVCSMLILYVVKLPDVARS